MRLSTAERSRSEPIRCLVVQLARLGDTLQSLMALKAAKQLYPQLEITFVSRSGFSAAAERVPWIKKVIQFPSDRILGPLLEGKAQEKDALLELAQWMIPLVDTKWDFVLNWSYSEASSYLTAIVPGTVKLGYTRGKDLSFSCADGWSHYMQAVVQGRVDQNIHLTDILTTQLLTAMQIHVGDPDDAGDTAVNSKSFFSIQQSEHPFLSRWRESTRKWIAFQLGAGRADKTWDPVHWAKLADLIVSRHPDWGIVLLGGPEDKERERAFLERLSPQAKNPARFSSLVGQTSFDLWVSVVSKCHWVIAGDTAVIHLASVLGTRVLNLSLGQVRWTETGPYGNGHMVVAPDAEGNLFPELVYGTWSYACLDRFQAAQKDFSVYLEALGFSRSPLEPRVYRSRIRPTQDGGGVVYEPLVRRSLTLREWTSMVMGQIARAWFCGWVAPTGHELTREMIGPELLKQLRLLSESSTVLLRICEEAARASHELADKGAKLRSDRLMSLKDRVALDEIGKKVLELDGLIARMGKTQDPFRAFSQMSKVMMHNLSGDQIVELGRESATCYRNLHEGVKIFKDWLEHTLKIARPVALKSVDSDMPAMPIP